jgi:carboxylesterase type B
VFILAFAIGTLIGIGLAATWIPEPRRKRKSPSELTQRYRRMRNTSVAAIEDVRRAARETAGELREELAANLEAARDELGDLARQQLDNAQRSLRREYKKLRR